MIENGLLEGAGTPIVEKASARIDRLSFTHAPKRPRLPFLAIGLMIGAIVGEFCTHIVKQFVAERINVETANGRGEPKR